MKRTILLGIALAIAALISVSVIGHGSPQAAPLPGGGEAYDPFSGG